MHIAACGRLGTGPKTGSPLWTSRACGTIDDSASQFIRLRSVQCLIEQQEKIADPHCIAARNSIHPTTEHRQCG